MHVRIAHIARIWPLQGLGLWKTAFMFMGALLCDHVSKAGLAGQATQWGSVWGSWDRTRPTIRGSIICGWFMRRLRRFCSTYRWFLIPQKPLLVFFPVTSLFFFDVTPNFLSLLPKNMSSCLWRWSVEVESSSHAAAPPRSAPFAPVRAPAPAPGSSASWDVSSYFNWRSTCGEEVRVFQKRSSRGTAPPTIFIKSCLIAFQHSRNMSAATREDMPRAHLACAVRMAAPSARKAMTTQWSTIQGKSSQTLSRAIAKITDKLVANMKGMTKRTTWVQSVGQVIRHNKR